MSTDLGMREMSESAQERGRIPTETAVCKDGASRLLRLADLAQNLGTEPVVEEARELAARVTPPEEIEMGVFWKWSRNGS